MTDQWFDRASQLRTEPAARSTSSCTSDVLKLPAPPPGQTPLRSRGCIRSLCNHHGKDQSRIAHRIGRRDLYSVRDLSACVGIVNKHAKGVEFLQKPEERPYGVEALCRDNSGNWIVLVEPREFSPADFA